ncbi:lysin A [Mycobacterium phage Phrappuccino]|uniref:Lysin A n=1 Tax=Mycobacterium phage Phrappuccino TaxID=2591223 RepID=A0A514DDJ1_9CAUD|nr:endolysin [Mycobacterium phage Phrappuccino]QDH91679.1 lysin A [Mycobacterium phage Phrappuccino]QIQ63123.1 lysin A [Mycobacterium phage Settecandela]
MTEKVLPYDRAVVPQEYGWSCGPAATQVVLNSRGIVVSETSLLNQIEAIENPGRGDDRDGTDYVGLIERVLDNIVPDARYTSVYLEKDPPTAAQKDLLWTHLKRSIDAGYGVVMNWVAPPSNKPRGVKGSVSPRYSGGTTYHYVAAMGYDDNPALRAVWIADSGFQPQGYWISFDQCASLIPPKGYAYADVTVTPPPAGSNADLVAILAQAMSPSSMPRETFENYLPFFAEAMRAAEINTVRRAAAWCSQVGHESGGLRYMAEIQTDGPGWTEDRKRYRGRGPIQLTWSSNYRKFGIWCKEKGYITDSEIFVNQPELVEQPKWGFLASSWYWLFDGPKPGQINGYADAGDNFSVSRCINGWITNDDGSARTPNGWDDRQARYNRCLALGEQLLKLTDAAGGDTELSAEAERMIREMYQEWRKEKIGPSRSFLAPDSNPIESPLGFIYNIDGNEWNGLNVWAYLFGVPFAVEAVERVAREGVHPKSYAATVPFVAEFGQAFCKGLVEFKAKLMPLLEGFDVQALRAQVEKPKADPEPWTGMSGFDDF